jgi:hypothetical protein
VDLAPATNRRRNRFTQQNKPTRFRTGYQIYVFRGRWGRVDQTCDQISVESGVPIVESFLIFLLFIPVSFPMSQYYNNKFPSE